MTVKTLLIASAILFTATSATLAQSQKNNGPAGNHGGDSYGQPYSGTAQARHQSGQ
jgi:hypothetical protein